MRFGTPVLGTLSLCVACGVGGCRTRTDRAASEPAPQAAASAAATRRVAAPSSTEPDAAPSSTEADAAPMSEPKRATWPRTPPPLRSDWCIEGVPALDDDACYVLPEAPTSELLIYLHGIVPPEVTSPIKTNFQNVVASASRSAGVVALLPRGKLGLAPRGYSRWWGWPTSDSSYRVHGPELAALIEVKRRQLEAALGTRFDRVYVAGSSSGGYFASALALKGGIQADGFGAMSSGHGVSLLGRVAHAPRPFYIGFGSYDDVERSARALAQFLRDAHWPVRVAEHPVGHGAKRVYLEEAFTFWRSSGAAAQ